MTTELTTVSERVEQYQAGVRNAVGIERDIQAFANRTLGGDLESVDHRLRARLNRIAEQLQLQDIVVGTGRAVSRDSPAKRVFTRREKTLRELGTVPK